MARLLLVDDDPAGLQIRKLILEREGHQVIVAGNVVEARSSLRANPPDVVIMDLRLPQPEDGRALIREFRVLQPGVRIVILSGCSTDLDRTEEAGMVDEILTKPVRSERLLKSVLKTDKASSRPQPL
jgi:DNA-binding response OmpR family regulator